MQVKLEGHEQPLEYKLEEEIETMVEEHIHLIAMKYLKK